ncbi:hypothetical protein AB0C77_09780 [Streptomyces sp. NPDC048629]
MPAQYGALASRQPPAIGEPCTTSSDDTAPASIPSARALRRA